MFDDRDFDRQFNRTWRLAIGGMIVSAIVWLSALVFAGWVIVKLLSYFGVV